MDNHFNKKLAMIIRLYFFKFVGLYDWLTFVFL